MRKGLLLSVLFFLMAGVSITVFAQMPVSPSAKTVTQESKPVKVKVQNLSGNVVSVDANQIIVNDKSGKSEAFAIDSKTVFKKGRKSIQISKISVDDKVTVKYRTEEEKKIAVSINIKKNKTK